MKEYNYEEYIMSNGLSVDKVESGSGKKPAIKFDFSDPQNSLKKIGLWTANGYYDVKNNGIGGMLSRGEVSNSDSAATSL